MYVGLFDVSGNASHRGCLCIPIQFSSFTSFLPWFNVSYNRILPLPIQNPFSTFFTEELMFTVFALWQGRLCFSIFAFSWEATMIGKEGSLILELPKEKSCHYSSTERKSFFLTIVILYFV